MTTIIYVDHIKYADDAGDSDPCNSVARMLVHALVIAPCLSRQHVTGAVCSRTG